MKTTILSVIALAALLGTVGCSNNKSGGAAPANEADTQEVLSTPVTELKSLPKMRIVETEAFNRASYVQAVAGSAHKTTVGYHQDVFFQAGEVVILKRLNRADKEIFGQDTRCNLELLKNSSVKIAKRNGKVVGTYRAEPYALTVIKQEQHKNVASIVLKAENAFLISCQQPADLGAINFAQIQDAFGHSVEFAL